MPWNDQIRRRLKLNDLHILLTVARRGSMGKAATELALSQPAVSKSVAYMERTLGVRLLDRTAFGAEPTLYGRALLKWGAAVFDDLRQSVNEIEFLADSTVGELRIGATEPIVAGLLPVVIGRLARQHPRLVFHVTQIPVVFQYREVRERAVDLMITRMPDPAAHDDLSMEFLFDDPQFVVAGKDNPWARRRNIKLADLVDDPWTLPRSDTAAGRLIAETFHACSLQVPQTAVVCNSIQMHNALLATGPFLAMFPRSLLHFSAKRLSIKVLPVELPPRQAPVGITTLKNRMISPVAQLFIETTREVVKKLARGN